LVFSAEAEGVACVSVQEVMSRPVSLADVQQELSVRGGLLPLMHLYPNDTTHAGNQKRLYRLNCCTHKCHISSVKLPDQLGCLCGIFSSQSIISLVGRLVRCIAFYLITAAAAAIAAAAIAAGSSIPWQPEDLRLQQWLVQDASYQAAAAELATCHE
jgi:hypothetical protein